MQYGRSHMTASPTLSHTGIKRRTGSTIQTRPGGNWLRSSVFCFFSLNIVINTSTSRMSHLYSPSLACATVVFLFHYHLLAREGNKTPTDLPRNEASGLSTGKVTVSLYPSTFPKGGDGAHSHPQNKAREPVLL